MSYSEKTLVSEEQISNFLADALKQVEDASNADILTLNEIKKLFKKNVPFSRRSYVAAYLIKQATSRMRFRNDRSERPDRRRGDRLERSERIERYKNSDRSERAEKSERPSRDSSQSLPHTPRVQIAPEAATTIFIGIGRNRRVFPRDLVGLLVGVAGIDRERIGDIRVLTNYSFIQLYTEDCEKAIAALNGHDYRGRSLSVSYSRQKIEGEGEDEGQKSEQTEAASSSVSEAVSQAVSEAVSESESIPAGVTNEGHAIPSETIEADRIAQAQTSFARREASISTGTADTSVAQFSQVSDDGQVTSHFGTGDAY